MSVSRSGHRWEVCRGRPSHHDGLPAVSGVPTVDPGMVCRKTGPSRRSDAGLDGDFGVQALPQRRVDVTDVLGEFDDVLFLVGE